MRRSSFAVEQWLIDRIAELCGVDRAEVGPGDPFTRHGIGSLALTGLTVELTELLGHPVPATAAWTYPTPRDLARHLAGAEPARSEQPIAPTSDPIAIIGLSCRLPGGPGPEEFWRLLSEGRDAVVDAPAGRGMTGRGGFLDRIDEFDAAFFSISPREAAHVDPQQRLALELAWEALENAGIPPRGLAGGRTGVFVGATWGEYTAAPEQLGQHSLAGNQPSVIPARISYALGLRGPSLQVNTACSSSLVAVHLAGQSLRDGDCDLALVGGVSLMLDPVTEVALQKLGALAPDGRSKAFDARADGYGRGEGGGFVVLRPLSAALAAGDRVLAVIRGSAVNNDGASNGLTAPNPLAQQELLASACQRAGISPADVQYVEAHGTGTELGDPIEASALNAVLCADRPAGRPLRIGSVKSSIGHLEAAAGIAGLIKVVLAMRHRALPPSLAFDEPNPHIPFEEWRLRVQQDLTEWTDDRLIAGVSAFGFGGTNCHVVLEGGQLAEPRVVTGEAVFVFGGQGSQWPGMAADLLRDEPVFRRAFERCDAVIAPRIGRSLTTLLDDDWLDDTAIVQPAIFAMQVALVELLRSRGVEPAAVTGSSLGEIAAAWTAGALDLETAAALMCDRSQVASGLSGSGAMAVLEMREADVADLLRGKQAWVAGVAGPRSTVVAGDLDAVQEAMAAAVRSGRIRVGYAAHSPHVEPIVPQLRAASAWVRSRACRIPFYSAVTGGELPGEALNGDYWVRMERDPWRLSSALEALLAAGHTVFVDVNPRAVLIEPIEQVIAESGKNAVALAALRPGETVLSGPRQPLLLLSARTREALRQAAFDMAEWLEDNQDRALNDVCHTLSARRSQHEFRLSVAGNTHAEMADALRAAEFSRAWADDAVFVFSGQGTYWSGMGRALLAREPAFRAAVESCDELFAPLAGWSLIDALTSDGPAGTDVLQPVLFAVQIGLVELLREHGITPAAVIGHSVGEVAAAYAAGVLSLADAVRVVHHRGRLMRRTAGLGRMASVSLSEAAARELPEVRGGRLDIAAVNDPNSVVLAGEREALDGLGGRELRVDHAFHSRQMDPILSELAEALSDITPQEPRIPIHSTGDRFDAGHWVRNVRDTVRFADQVSAAVAAGHRLFVEVGPHPALVESIEECVAAEGRPGRAVGVLRRGEENVLRALGELYRHGLDVSFVDGSLIDLPGYPWQRERYWHSGGHARDHRLHTLEWRRRDHHEPVTSVAGTWLVLRDELGVGAAVAERLRSYGAECVDSVEALSAAPAGVVWPYGAHLTIEELHGWRDLPRVWLLTHDRRQASLWGLGKSLALRHPEFDWARIDFDGDVDLLVRELAAGSAETDVLLRQDGRYVARVVRAADAVGRDGGLTFRDGGTYLVIDADVEVPRGHVIGEHRGEPLDGIVYGGGRADVAWQLHELSLDHDLDFFVLLSSGASLLGDGPDAESGAVFDVIARHRRDLGLPAFSIGGDHRVLGSILPSAPAQVTVVDLDVRQWLEAHPAAAGAPLLSELPRDTAREPSQVRQAILAAAPPRRRALLVEHLIDQLARTLHQEPSAVDESVPFRSLGLESLMAVELRNRLETSIGVRLPIALLFTYSTVSELAEHLLADMAEPEPGTGAAVAEHRRDLATEPIAIVGMGLRVPGGADDPESFWHLLDDQVDAVTEVPEHRWARTDGPAGWGGFLSEVDGFDAKFFGISPREAKSLDPQQRLLLEVTWEALERAGIPPEGLTGSDTGVFVGVVVNDYDKLNAADRDIYTVTGNGHSFPAGRLSYQLGAQGPSMTVDTACSSSLVAIHLACQSLRAGETTLALAGGVNLMLDPDMSTMLAGSNALSPDGRCRTFDSRANGYVRGEGCGVLVLKRLPDAKADGDPVLAVIRGSAVNSDGRSSGLTAPNVTAQKALLRQALRNAGAESSEVGYVETHGTGTPLGDPIEVAALADVLDGDRCVLGAVKTNIGHLEAAAGVVGVIKTVLVMQRRRIPANLHMRTLNPRIDLTGTPLAIAAEPMEWQPGKLAGVSSFGISGTNAHVVLAEPPPAPEPVQDGPALLPISARTEPALRALAASYVDFASRNSLTDMAHTAAYRRHHHPHRAVFVVDSPAELAAKAGAFARGEAPIGVVSGRAHARPKVVFVFPGQGSQWVGMGRDLYAVEPVFAEALRRCDEAIRTEAGWSVIDVLHSDDLGRVGVIQPVLFAMEIALAELWREHGVQPDVVVGHSMGEVAAAHVAGALSLVDAVKVICRRSSMLERISGQGVMALVELSLGEAEAALSTVADQVSVAAANGPRSTVISGTATAVDQVLLRLTGAGVFCRRVRVEVAAHSPQVDPLTAGLLDALGDLAPVSGSIPLHSTVTGQLGDGADMGADYWVRNLRAPVLFGPVVGELLKDGPTVFVEVSPHPVLLPSIDEVLTEGSATVASLRRDRPAFREAVGALHVHGVPVRWARTGRCVALPAYPWQRERHWVDPAPPSTRTGGHPLLGEAVELATQPGVRVFSGRLDAPYLADHRVHGRAVLPGAASVEMALHATQAQTLVDIDFDRQVAVDGQSEVQLILSQDGFELFCRDESGWRRFASGEVGVAGEPARASLPRLTTEVPVADHYREQAEKGIEYGPAFRGIERLWIGDGEAVARIAAVAGGHVFHPALLDACFQVFGALVGGAAALVPVAVGRISLHSRPPGQFWVHARATGDLVVFDDDEQVIAEITGLRARELPVRQPYEDWLYELSWRQTKSLPAAESTGKWLVLADRGGVGAQLAQRLPDAVVAFASDGLDDDTDWDRLLDTVPDCTGIVHMWGLDAIEPTTLDSLAADQWLSTYSALRLVRAVLRRGLRDTPRLWLVTKGALSTSPLLGFGRTLDMEHPEFRSVRVELDGSVEDLLPELLAPDGESELALGPWGRRVARLTRRAAGTPGNVDWSGTYLITGGLGGLGIGLAEWMAEQGARHIVLLGRTARSLAAVQALRAKGVEVVVAQADVTRRADVARVLADIDRRMPPLKGVVHAAMVLDDRTVLDLDEERFARVLAPKVLGAWNLHELTADHDLDFFVLYSSASNIIGSPGQANYAAANAFLGALARHRAALGKPALCVDWGLFAEAGIMADRAAEGSRLADRGIGTLTPEQGTEILGALLGSDVTHIAALRLNLRQWLEFFPSAAASPLFAELQDLQPRVAAVEVDAGSVEPLVLAELGRTLHLNPARIDRTTPFSNMGVDSLMALELRNRLEAVLGVRLSVAVLFAAPTVAALSEYLIDKLGLAEAVDEFAEVSTDDLLARLDESLARVEGGSKQ